MPVHVGADALRVHTFDDLWPTQHGTAHGLVRKSGFLEVVEDDVVGCIVGLVYFLKNHRLLSGQFLGIHD